MIRKCRVHAVTDSEALTDPSFEAKAGALAGTGLAALALRAGTLDGRTVYNLALRLREITARSGAPLVINSRLDIALAVGADFVQLGYHSVPLEAAAPLCKAHGLGFGCSCHSLEQALQAVAAGATYVYLGTVFATASKPGVQPVGVELVREVCRFVTSVPVFAIGGMSAATVPQVAAAGAFGCAVVSALWRPADPREELVAMSRAFGTEV